MLSVVTPATSTRLTTVSRAVEVLGYGEGDDAAVLQRCIETASQAIVDHCRRPFALATYRERICGPETGPGYLLGRSPVVEILSVTADGTVLRTDDYELDTETNRLWRVDGYGSRRWWWGAPLIVEYDAGYTLPTDTGSWTLPEPVERSCILLAAAYLSQRNRDPLTRSESVEGVGSTTWWVPSGSGLPSPEAEQLLQPYRRMI